MADVWSEIQRNTAEYSKSPYSPQYTNTAARRLMSQAITLAELQRRLQIRLTSPIQAAHRQRNYASPKPRARPLFDSLMLTTTCAYVLSGAAAQ